MIPPALLATLLPRALLAAAALATLGAAYFAGYVHGKGSERTTWEVREADQRAKESALAASRAVAAQEITEARAESREAIRNVTRTILKEVPVYVPSASCDLPAGYRLLHDAAAAGVPPPPEGTDAAPVPAQAAAATVIDNYGTCRDNADRLEKLQRWAGEVTKE